MTQQLEPPQYAQQDAVRLQAYYLWEQRGKPWGSPEADWFTAEAELQSQDQNTAAEPSTVTVAKVVGSVLGSVAGLVTSLADSMRSE